MLSLPVTRANARQWFRRTKREFILPILLEEMEFEDAVRVRVSASLFRVPAPCKIKLRANRLLSPLN